MKRKLLLISGCSHAAGSEIDGFQDSIYNRANSFGNLFAQQLGYEPINASALASNNQCIARTVLEWFKSNYNPLTMDVKVLIAWTESSRINVPNNHIIPYDQINHASDFVPAIENKFIKVNLGYKGAHKEEILKIESCHKFILENTEYIELISSAMVLKLQYFLKLNKIDYIMCNTMHMFTPNLNDILQIDLIDNTRYMYMNDNNESFFWKYKNLGYTNSKAKFWHHDEIPHKMYSEELLNFYDRVNK